MSSEYKYYYRQRNGSITHRPFTLNQMDAVEAFIEQYNYVSKKYPEYRDLEKLCRKEIFLVLLDRMFMAYKAGYIETHKEKLLDIINLTKKYDISNCGLDKERKAILNLLFTDIRKYIVGIKILTTNRI